MYWRRIVSAVAAVCLLAGQAQAELMDVPKVKSGVWEGYCSTYGRCAAGINSAYFTAQVGPLKFKPTFQLVYESKGDRFKLSMTMFYTPPGFKVDLRNSYVLLPNGKVRFKEQSHGDAGRGRFSSNIFVPIRRKDRQIKNIMSYLARANTMRVHLSYSLNGKRYEGPVDFSLRGSTKVLTTVYAQFDEKGRTFEAGKKVRRQPPAQVTWEKRSCNSGMFNWCVFTDNPEMTAAFVKGGLIALDVLSSAQSGSYPAPSSSRKTFQCTVACSTNGLAATMGIVGDSARDVTVTVKASSASAASRLAMDDRGKICRQAKLAPVATIVTPTCR